MFARSRLLLSSLALAACSGDSTGDPRGAGGLALAVHGANGFENIWPLGGPATPIVVPTISRSELVVRAELTRLGLGLRTAAASLGVEAVAHPPDHQVVVTRDRGVLLVGPPVLPRRFESGSGELAHVARKDGLHVSGGNVRVHPPPAGVEGRELVLIGGGGPFYRTGLSGLETPRGIPVTPPRFQGGATVLSAENAPLDLNLPGDSWLDQVFYAEVTRATTVALNPNSSDVGSSEVWFEVPPLEGEGRVWSFLVSVDSEGQPPENQPSAALFEDWSAIAGISMVHFEGPDEQLDIRPTMGPGAAWGDIDGDGWVDLYLVQGGGRAGSDPLPNRLFRNDGEGRLQEVPDGGGAGDTGAGMGTMFFDADGDGDLDLYVANYGTDKLYANDGMGTFTDVSQRAGLTHDFWSAGVAAADYDGDGDLDVYVTSYLDYDPEKMPPADELGRYQREDPIEMLPFAFPGQRNVFLRNDGDLHFTDVTADLDLLDVQGRGMQPVFWDFDRDGDQDLYVANDVSFNVLFRNEGDGTFKDISFSTGLDDPRGGMGLAIGDVDRDTDEDVFLTNWQLEANGLYLNNLVPPPGSKHRRSTFFDGTVRSNLGPAGIGATSWSCVLFDFDNDTDLDLFIANGYTSPDYESTGICVGQPNHLFLGRGDGRFDDAGASAGPALARKLASRAAAACDFDQDGRVDLVVTANNGPVQLLANRAKAPGHWLIVRLRGSDGNTFAVGAEVAIEVAGATLVRSLRVGNGYLSCDAPELHFGLGDAVGPVTARVRWPSGAESEHPIETVDRVVELRE